MSRNIREVPLRHSLGLKLVLAFILVSVTGVALATLSSRWAAHSAFKQLLLGRARREYIARATAYYEQRGSWDGIVSVMHADTRAGQPQPRPGTKPQQGQAPPLAFALLDAAGRVVVPGGPFQRTTQVPPRVIAQSVPIRVDGDIVGRVVTSGEPPTMDPLEAWYVRRTNRVSLLAALGATAVALTLGALLASGLTNPLRRLTHAAHAMADGELSQNVPVDSQDELGELARAFNHMSADLSQAMAARRQMTADIAHDLRTPLTVISGYLEALRDGDLKPTQPRFEMMYDEAQSLLRLVEDLRMLSLADAGRLTLNRVPIAPGTLLERLKATYQHAADQASVGLTLDAAPDLPVIRVDVDRMMQVLGNLMSNALRYTAAGGQIRLQARRGRTEASDGEPKRVEITVADTGSGIPADALPHIFDRFYRVDEARAQQADESGLGLAIVRSIVEAHGGRIDVASEVGVGTTFTISLPT
jgi:signal transduction histidine kinase